MTGSVKTVDWDALAASAPQNATAGKVVSQRGTHYEPAMGEQPHTFRSDIRPEVKDPRHVVASHRAEYERMVGSRVGRLTILGIWVGTRSKRERKGKGAVWVVRCDCGWYEHRKAKALKAGMRAVRLARWSACAGSAQRRRD